jgi:glycosyltransferase involved in cell wall biosynthesis
MSTKRKILYMVTQTEWGGAQNYIFNLIGKLDKNKWQPSVAVGEDADSDWMRELKDRYIPVYKLRHLKREISPWHDFLSGLEQINLFKKIRPDIIHLNSSKTGATGAVMAALYKKYCSLFSVHCSLKVVYTVHGFVFNEPLGMARRKFYLLAERASSRFKDKIISVSEHDRIIGINEKIAPANKFTTIHNGLDFGKLKFLKREEARSDLKNKIRNLKFEIQNSLLVGTIANLYTTKGLKYLVKSARAVLQKFPNCIFVVVGKGGQEKELRKKIASLGLEEKFFLVGEISQASRLALCATRSWSCWHTNCNYQSWRSVGDH